MPNHVKPRAAAPAGPRSFFVSGLRSFFVSGLVALTTLAGCATSESGVADDPGPPAVDAGPVRVDFSYRPLWAGVSAVEVIGGFGRTSDWKQPLLKLAAQPDGSFAGTATLPRGAYAYLFAVHGDVHGATPQSTRHYSVDPAAPVVVFCPSAAPTYSSTDLSMGYFTDVMVGENPCSQLVVPKAQNPAQQTLSGRVTYDSGAAPGYLVVLERNEPGLFPYFTQMTESTADGSYWFQAVPGQYRVQVQHPTFEKLTDATRDPMVLQAMRRAVSAPFSLPGTGALPTVLSPVDAAYHGYGPIAMQGKPMLPLSLQFSPAQAQASASLALYGLEDPAQKNIGYPWFVSPRSTKPTPTATFDGTFNTPKAREKIAIPGEGYYLGTLETVSAAVAPAWTRQSMVYPITFFATPLM